MFFSEIPQPIKQWLGSDSTTDELASINDFLELEGDEQLTIFYALSNLELKKVSLEQFYADLQTKLAPLAGEEKTRQAIQTINEKILDPIKVDLINFGVLPTDWALEAAPATQPAETTPLSQTEKPAAEKRPTEETISAPQTVQAQPAAPEILKPSFKNEPFVFHQAEQPPEPTTQPEQPAFGIGYKIIAPDDVAAKKQETPPAEPVPQIPPTAEPTTRIVNYSEFRTPLEKSEVAQPPIQPIPGSQKTIPAASSQNVVNLKRNEAAQPEPTKENPENTINLKDLPL